MLGFDKAIPVAKKTWEITFRKRSNRNASAPLFGVSKTINGREAIVRSFRMFYTSNGYMDDGSPTIRNDFAKKRDRFV